MTRERVSKILELKSFTKEQLEFELKKSRDEAAVEKLRLDGLRGSFEDACAEFSVRQDGGELNAGELEVFFSYFHRLNSQIEQQKGRLAEKLAEVDEKQKAMLEAYKEKRVFEILYERLFREELRKEGIHEQKEVDYDFIARKMRG